MQSSITAKSAPALLKTLVLLRRVQIVENVLGGSSHRHRLGGALADVGVQPSVARISPNRLDMSPGQQERMATPSLPGRHEDRRLRVRPARPIELTNNV